MLEFFGVKNRVGWRVQPVGTWAGRWLKFLHCGREMHSGETKHSGNCVQDLEEHFTLFVAETSWLELQCTTQDDLGHSSYGPAEGARCSPQGVGKPVQLRSTMPI